MKEETTKISKGVKRIFLAIWEIVKITLIALVIVIPIREFVFQPFFVRGSSMEPNFHDFDYLIIDELSYRFGEPQRGDVIVFRNPSKPQQRFIKRIIGLPGETIEIADNNVEITRDSGTFILDESEYLIEGIVTAGAHAVFLKEDEYFVLGDNRPYSFDSRSFGFVPGEYIVGKVALKFWPLSAFAKKVPNLIQ